MFYWNDAAELMKENVGVSPESLRRRSIPPESSAFHHHFAAPAVEDDESPIV
jgi:hypothetical protein